MVLDIIGAAILIAFGLLIIFFSAESKTGDEKFMLIFLLGIACVVIGAWIIITKITLAVLLKKLAGLILAGVGFFLVTGFPDITQYQNEKMGITGVFIGIVLIIVGLFLLFF